MPDRIMADVRKKILCIEDDRETAGLIAEELFDRGYEVTIAHDGRGGLAAILRVMPDLVLSDISMPAMSGFELLERLTALAPRFSNMPFVFLTALTDRERTQRPTARRRRLCHQADRFRFASHDHRSAVESGGPHRTVAENGGSERTRDRSADLGGARQDLGRDRANPRIDQAHGRFSHRQRARQTRRGHAYRSGD